MRPPAPHDRLLKEIEKLEAENKRLRETLGEIADYVSRLTGKTR